MKILLLPLLLLANFAVATAQQAKPAPLPSGIEVLRDIEYVPGGGERHSLDIYVPEKAGAPLPLVVWIHGGAWKAGNKANPRALPLLGAGFAVAAINYRYSSEAVFPAQIEDCRAAIRFLRANAAKYRIDPKAIGVWGSSAGGHLVAMLGTAGDMKDWDKGQNLDQSSRVQAVCDWFGPSDLLTMGAQGANDRPLPATDSPESPESQLIGGNVQDHKDKARAASPVNYVSPGDPPFFIVHGTKDPLVPLAQSRELHEALKLVGVDTTLHVVQGGGHGQGFDPALMNTLARDFFTKHLVKR